MIGPDAVLLGPLAPLLTQDSRYRSHPYFGPPGERGLLEKYGVTHIVECGGGDTKELEQRYPGLLDSTRIVQIWPMRTLFASTLELRRLPTTWHGVPIHRYQPTTFEHGAEAAGAGRWQDAPRIIPRNTPRGRGRDARAHLPWKRSAGFKPERYVEAEKLPEGGDRSPSARSAELAESGAPICDRDAADAWRR
jgi:hypothetical protein